MLSQKAMLLDKFKDPSGLTDFRLLTEDFTSCVGKIHKQRQD